MIRYDQAYNQNISKVVSNFNRKVRRLEKAGAELLPSKVSVREIKSLYTNRRDLNTYLRDLKRFSKRGAEEVITVDGKRFTKYEVEVFKAKLRRERRAVDRDIARAESMRSKYPMQHSINLQNMRNKRAALSSNWNDLITTKMKEMVENYARKVETYDNYMEILFQDAYTIDYDEEKIQYIRSKLLELSPNQFIKALEDSPEIQEIFNSYHSMTRQSAVLDENEAREKYDVLYSNIDEIVAKYK